MTEPDLTGLVEADQSAPTDDQLAALANLLREERRQAAELEALEADLKRRKEAYTALVEVTLPDALDAVGFAAPTKTVIAGLNVKYEKKLYGGLPKDAEKLAAGLAYLEQLGLADLVKHAVTVQFDREEDALFRAFVADLRAKTETARISVTDTVHPQTLLAAIRELRERGEDLELPTLGVYERRVVGVKPPKAGGI